MSPEIWGSFHRVAGVVKARFNPVRLAVYMTYVMASVAMFLYGYYIELNETSFGFATMPAARAVDDQIFTRAHLLLVFGSLPVIAVFLIAAELLGDTSGARATLKRWMAGSVLLGMLVSTAGMGTWVFSTPGHETSWDVSSAGAILYMLGQGLILVGAIFELFTFGGARAGELAHAVPQPEPTLEPEQLTASPPLAS